MKINSMFCIFIFFIVLLFFNASLAEAAGDAWAYRGDPSTTVKPSSKNGILIVNKSNPLPKNYAPVTSVVMNRPAYDLGPEASTGLNNLKKAATSAGYSLDSFSGYRNYDRQTVLYNDYVKKNSVLEADKFSARPGYSEHQTGMAFDIKDKKAPAGCEFEKCGNTSAMKWLSENAHDYGFILRYTSSNSLYTGFQSEFWHYRYIGVDNAKLYKSGGYASLEQFLNIGAGETIYSLDDTLGGPIFDIPGIGGPIGIPGIGGPIGDALNDIKNGNATTPNACGSSDDKKEDGKDGGAEEGKEEKKGKNSECKEYDETDYTKYTDKDIDVTDLGNVGVNTKKNYDSGFQEYKLNSFMKWILNSFHILSLTIAILVFGYVTLVWMLILLARTHMAPIEDFLRKITMDSVDPHENLGSVIKTTIIIMFIVVIAVSGLMPVIFGFIYEMIMKVLEYIEYN